MLEFVFLMFMVLVLALFAGGIAGWVALARTNTLKQQVSALQLTSTRLGKDMVHLREMIQRMKPVEADEKPQPLIESPAEVSTKTVSDLPQPDTSKSKPKAAKQDTVEPLVAPVIQYVVDEAEATDDQTPADQTSTAKEQSVTNTQISSVEDEPKTTALHKAISLEEKLGTRLFVWVGGLALLLAGAFLVKYAVDQSWLTQGVRVTLGFAFGAALIGSSFWFKPRSERIAPALCGAGIGVLYASILAGTNLYSMWPGWLGFVLMGINTVGAIVLSLGMGPGVAVLGMLGGFSTPMLIGDIEPSAGPGVLYLLVLQGGLLLISRRRAWSAIATFTLVLAGLWGIIWAGFRFETDNR